MMPKPKPVLFFVVALSAEAAPLVAHYQLARDPDASLFPCFRHPKEGMALVVSGPGKIAAAAATAFLATQAGDDRVAGWINVGIAGHGTAKVGDIFLGHKIRDLASGRSFYPPLTFAPPIPTGEILTVDRVERTYPEAVVYDMEASGFYETACRASTAECVHCIKVVTDGPQAASVESINRAHVEKMIADRLSYIDRVVEQVRILAAEANQLAADPPHYRSSLERWHFTVSESRRLRQLLRRWQAAWPNSWPEEELRELRRGKDVLRTLERLQADLPVLWQ